MVSRMRVDAVRETPRGRFGRILWRQRPVAEFLDRGYAVVVWMIPPYVEAQHAGFAAAATAAGYGILDPLAALVRTLADEVDKRAEAGDTPEG